MSDLVSVIISAYNHEKYVQETIQSIIDQTYQNIELLIIDDGSPDDTLEKIIDMKEKCKKRFTNVVIQAQENQGTCLSFNRLISQAKGEYIFILASDDKAAPEAIETLHKFLSKNPEYALAVGENHFIDFESKPCYWDEARNIVYNKEEAQYLSFTDFLMAIRRGNVDFLTDEFGTYESLLKGNYIPNGYLIRKSIFEKTGYYTPKAPLEDYYLMLQISKYAKMKYLPKPLFYYRWHDNNTASQIAKMIELTRVTLLYEISQLTKYTDPNIQRTLLAFISTILPIK